MLTGRNVQNQTFLDSDRYLSHFSTLKIDFRQFTNSINKRCNSILPIGSLVSSYNIQRVESYCIVCTRTIYGQCWVIRIIVCYSRLYKLMQHMPSGSFPGVWSIGLPVVLVDESHDALGYTEALSGCFGPVIILFDVTERQKC